MVRCSPELFNYLLASLQDEYRISFDDRLAVQSHLFAGLIDVDHYAFSLN